MDVKGSTHTSAANLVLVDKEDSIVHYIAVKGSLHAHDCAIFGLKQEEVQALDSKFSRSFIEIGHAFKANVMVILNALVQLGYRVISSTVMDHAHHCDHARCSGAANTNVSVMQTLYEMEWERGIWNAAFDGDLQKVRSLVDKAMCPKSVVSAPDNAGYTALHYAARSGVVDICQFLLENGADVNAQTKSKATPLHKAAASGKITTVNWLLSHGACATAQDVDGETALHKAVSNKRSEVIDVLMKTHPTLQNIADGKGRLPFQ